MFPIVLQTFHPHLPLVMAQMLSPTNIYPPSHRQSCQKIDLSMCFKPRLKYCIKNYNLPPPHLPSVIVTEPKWHYFLYH